MKTIACLLLLALTGCFSSTTVKKLAKDLDEYDKLGMKKIVVKTNVNSTDYTVEHKDGIRTATINHHSVYIPELILVRETKEK